MPKRRQWPWILGSILLVGFALSTLIDTEPSETERLVSLCHKAVADRAVAPSTVSFVTLNLVKADLGGTASGDVDGQNMFGAMLRSPYAGDLRAGLEGEKFGYYVHVVD